MRRALLILLSCLALSSPAFSQTGQTIDQLTPGTALGGTEKFPMWQGSNPATTSTTRAFATYMPTQLNAIDATQSAGADMCAQIAAAAATLVGRNPLGGDVYTQGFAGSSGALALRPCGGSMWSGVAALAPANIRVIGAFGWWLDTRAGQQPPANATFVSPYSSMPCTMGNYTQGPGYQVAPCQQLQPAYVATTGGGGTACTFASPCSFTGLQTKLQGNPTVTGLGYVRGGTYSIGSGQACSGAAVIDLSHPTDIGTTYSYFPPDGVGSAIIDGGSTSNVTGLPNGITIGGNPPVSNIQINGLTFQNICGAAVKIATNILPGVQNVLIVNNTMQNSTAGDGFDIVDAANNITFAHNYIHNIFNMGINSVNDFNTTVYSNVVYDSNYVRDVCRNNTGSDCGCFYFENNNTPISPGPNLIINNYCEDVNLPGAPSTLGICIYMDNLSSNTTISGNVCTGAIARCFNFNAGTNNSWTGNICDLTTNTAANAGFALYPTSPAFTPNKIQNNIFLANAASTYCCGWQTGIGYVSNNLYWNYNASNAFNTTGDLNPTSGNGAAGGPNLNCWAVQSLPGTQTPNPVAFPGIVGGWGPIGFVVPQTGTAPSWPHAC